MPVQIDSFSRHLAPNEVREIDRCNKCTVYKFSGSHNAPPTIGKVTLLNHIDVNVISYIWRWCHYLQKESR